jgi:hypothetical protein
MPSGCTPKAVEGHIAVLPQQRRKAMTDLTKRAFFGAVAVGAVVAATAAIAQPIVIEPGCVEVIDDDWCWFTEGGRRVRRRRGGGGGGREGAGAEKSEGGGGEKSGGRESGGGAKGSGDPGGGGKGK